MFGQLGKRSCFRVKLIDSAVTGHFNHPHSRPWKHVDAPLTPLLAKVLGAQEDEVAHTSTLTSNMHNLFIAFYRPTEKRWKIVIEKGSFPSDWVSVEGLKVVTQLMS
jgi:kynureninase